MFAFDFTVVDLTAAAATYTLSGADAGNYVVEQPTGLSATVNKANLAVSGITAVNKTYDATTAATLVLSGATFNGMVSGDALTGQIHLPDGTVLDCSLQTRERTKPRTQAAA